MEILIHLLLRYPKLAAAFSLIFTLAFGAGSIMLAAEVISVDKEPRQLSISEAAQAATDRSGSQIWVALTDGSWDCDTLKQSEFSTAKNTDILLVDSSKSIVVVAYFNKHLSCDEIKQQTPSGYFKTVSGRRLDVLNTEFQAELARFENPPRIFDLCMTCSPDNSTTGVWVLAALTIAAAAVYPLSRYYHNKYAVSM